MGKTKMTQKYTPSKDSGVINPAKVPDPALSIGHYGYEVAKKDKKPVNCKYSAFRLHFVVKGKVKLSFAGKSVVLEKNSLFVLIPNADIVYETDKSLRTELYWVTYNGYNALQYTNMIGLSEAKPYLVLPKGGIIKSFFDNYNAEYADSPMLELIMQKNLLDIFITAYEQTPESRPALVSRAAHNDDKLNIKDILTYLSQNISDPDLSLKTMAEHLHFHPNYLSRVFKNEMSLTFSKYLTMRRIEYSVSLIEQGYTNVGLIANLCGFKDPLYFSRVFKKVETVPPTEVILKYQQNAALKEQAEALKSQDSPTPPPEV